MSKNKSTRLPEEEHVGVGDELLKNSVVNIRMKSLTLDESTEAINPSMSKEGQLLSIHDMPGTSVSISTSNLSMGTNENYHEVGNRPLLGDDEVVSQVDVLPEEVWKLIFEFFNNQDMLSVSRSYTKWGDWLADKRTLFLFHKVLPLIRNELSLADLLRLRPVCKAWKNDLDDASFFPTPAEALVFKNGIEIERFLQQMASHPGNPFPRRCIRFKLEGNPMAWFVSGHQDALAHTLYWTRVNDLLDRFGHHARTVYIFLNGEHADRLRQCLTRLPQLKCLAVECGGFMPWRLPHRNANQFHLPKLLHLEELRTGPKVPDDMVDAILRSCYRHVVKSLDLAAGFHDGIYSFPNLEILNATVHSTDLRMYLNLKLSPPLQRIKLKVYINSFGMRPAVAVVDFKNLFSLLEQFAETLTHIQVHGYNELKVEDHCAYKINLPKLKSLKLCEYAGPLDPLIELRSLTHLEIYNIMATSNLIWEHVALCLGQRGPVSDVWTLLPSLKWLKCHLMTQWKSIEFSGHRPDEFHPPVSF